MQVLASLHASLTRAEVLLLRILRPFGFSRRLIPLLLPVSHRWKEIRLLVRDNRWVEEFFTGGFSRRLIPLLLPVSPRAPSREEEAFSRDTGWGLSNFSTRRRWGVG